MKTLKNIAYLYFLLSIFPSQLPAQEYWAGFSNVKYDGKYFYAVAEQLYQVVKLDKRGNVVDVFGKRGRGPAEFATDNLELMVNNRLLYVMDDRGFSVTVLNKNTFAIVKRKTIKKPPYDLVSHQDKIYVSVIDFKGEQPTETGGIVKVFRSVDSLTYPEATLFSYSDPNPINPFYDAEAVYANDEVIIITREGKGSFTIFNRDSLYQKQVPFVEEIALGYKITRDTEFLERPIMKIFWKKKVMPEYKLMKSGYLDGQRMYFQVHSYKAGNALIGYNIQEDTFDRIGTLSQGKLIAVDNDIVYTLNHTTINTTTLSGIRSCSDEAIAFYFSSEAFGEQCMTCINSFFEWYDYAKQNNIPVKLILEDDSWFGKEEIDAQTVNTLTQWNLWGEISYKKDCEDCFDSSVTARVVSNGTASEFYSFPKSISVLKNKLACTN